MTKLLIFLFLLSLSHHPINAQKFTSEHYIINLGNFNMTSGYKTSDNFRLTDTVGQNFAGVYQKDGVLLKSGFQYIYDTFYQFSFAIDNNDIDFGSLVSDVATTATTTLSLSTPSGNGYQIIAHQNQSLTNITGTTIPDTSCDNGTCTESVSSIWSNSTTYGFGFNATGIGSTGIFPTTSSFRQFANINQSEIPQVIASENNPVQNRQTEITYKVNIPANQPAGTYYNFITYTAVPIY